MGDHWSYPVPQAMQRHTGSHLTPPVAAKEPAPPAVPAPASAAEPAPPLASPPPNDDEATRGTGT